MKKLMFVFATAIILVGCASSRTSKQVKNASHPLIGMWQYCQPVILEDESTILTHRPIFKTICTDGRYWVSAGGMEPVEGTPMQEVKTILTQEGRFEIKNDSTYHELIDKHNYPTLSNTTSVFKYKFEGEHQEYLHVDFVNTETGFKVSEIWRRVTFVDGNK